MTMKRMVLVASMLTLTMTAVACSGSSDAGSEPKDTDKAKTTTTTNEDKDDSTTSTTAEEKAGSVVQASNSAGATLAGQTQECTIDGTSGKVVSIDGAFELTFEDGTGQLTWTYDGGVIDEEPAVNVADRTITVSGTTEDGLGYNAEITCA